MAKIGTTGAAAATAYPFNLNYVPQFLFFVAAAAPSLRCSVLGDGVITDLDAAGCTFVQGLRLSGRVTNGYMIPLANGLITGKNLEIIYTTGGAVAIDIYAISMQKGDAFVQCLKQTVIASSGAEIKKFAALGLGNAAAGDIININYADGLSTKVELAELKATLALYCNDVNNVQGIDNVDAEISSVQFTPAATQVVHIVKYALPSNVNQSLI